MGCHTFCPWQTLCSFIVIFSTALSAAAVPPGSTVRVVAPSFKGSFDELPLVRDYITAMGLVPSMRDDIYSNDDPLYANTDQYRALDLATALTEANSNSTNNRVVIWCIHGGAGTARLIPYLEESLPSDPSSLDPKLLIGFSDITVLHAYLAKKYGWSTIHGPMLSEIVGGGVDEESVALLWDIIYGRRQQFEYSIQCLNHYCKNQSSQDPSANLTSVIVGGTLTIIRISIGTVWELETQGALVFLEDVGEEPYFNEQLLDHLVQAGLFETARGVLLGEFGGSGDENLNQFVLQRFADSQRNIPVYRLRNVGHNHKNLPLPLNTRARIEYVDGLNRLLTVDVPNY